MNVFVLDVVCLFECVGGVWMFGFGFGEVFVSGVFVSGLNDVFVELLLFEFIIDVIVCVIDGV